MFFDLYSSLCHKHTSLRKEKERRTTASWSEREQNTAETPLKEEGRRADVN
jgi:hypothetical protein